MRDEAEAVVSLVKHTTQAARAGDIGVQEIANTAYGAARTGKGKQMGVLFIALARAAAKRRMRDSISQQLVSTPWVFSRVGHQEEQLLFTALAAAAERRMRDFNLQGRANTAWAFATVRHKEERLFTAVAVAAFWRMRDFSSQDLANTAWEFATVGHKEEQCRQNGKICSKTLQK